MQHRAIYHNAETHSSLLLTWDTDLDGWITDRDAMAQWIRGETVVYHPTDCPTLYITTSGPDPNFLPWRILTPAEQQRDVREMMPHPWIPTAAVVCVHYADIPAHLASYIRTATDTSHILRTVAHLPRPPLPRPPPIEIPAPHEHAPFAALVAAAAYSHAHLVRRSLPSHIVALVLREAVATGATCPITMDAITATNATVTGCGHVFQTDALARWLEEHDSCPECRDPISNH